MRAQKCMKYSHSLNRVSWYTYVRKTNKGSAFFLI